MTQTATAPAIIDSRNRWTNEYISFCGEWIEQARPEQIAPAGDWRIWAAIAGRGFGKTRMGVQWSLSKGLAIPNQRIAVIAPTQNDCRTVCFEGESGLNEKLSPFFKRHSKYSKQDLELRFSNGALFAGKSAEKPDRLRGPQWHYAWCDEVASWGAVTTDGKPAEGARLKDTWSNLDFGLRLGKRPQAMMTTTPRPIKFVRDLLKNKRCVISRGSTFDNAANLAASAIESFADVYEGTRIGQQELYGDILAENDNALWRYSQFEAEGFRVFEPPQLARIVVAIDPAVTSVDNSDETGIIVAGITEDRHVYVLHDASGKYRPLEWAREALALYQRFDADAIVGETNQGGDLIEANLEAEAQGRYFRFIGVHAKRGKYLRAEPVAAYYEKKRVHHCGLFEKLESQMCEFTGSASGESPDRLDAAVYAATELMLGTQTHAFY